MTTLGDLHDHYVLTDVLLLVNVFERFRDMTLDYYKLDACHNFKSPGLAWDATLKMTGVSLDLITDPLMYNFFELGLRGGLSMISKNTVRQIIQILKITTPPNLSKISFT